MSMLGRLRAYRKGHRLLRLGLVAQQREGGHIFVKSPDLPGFSVMLTPAEIDDFDLFVSALGRPLVAFVNAEHRSAQRLKDGSRVRLKGMQPLRTSSKFYADLCTA